MDEYMYVLRNIDDALLDKLYKLCYITGEQIPLQEVRRCLTSKL